MREAMSNLGGPALALAVWLMALANLYVAERPRPAGAAAQACPAGIHATLRWDATPDRPAEVLTCP